eukprot:scaffold74018_cov36-Phaeocystis_antarctica.AAC.1
MYVGGNAAARQRMPEGEALRNPWRLVNNTHVSARAAMCAMCDELTRDPIGVGRHLRWCVRPVNVRVWLSG